MLMESIDIRRETASEDEVSARSAAAHVVDIARLLAEMPRDMASAVSSTQTVHDAEGQLIRRLAPSLAARYGFRVAIEQHGLSLTVRFERARH